MTLKPVLAEFARERDTYREFYLAWMENADLCDQVYDRELDQANQRRCEAALKACLILEGIREATRPADQPVSENTKQRAKWSDVDLSDEYAAEFADPKSETVTITISREDAEDWMAARLEGGTYFVADVVEQALRAALEGEK